MTQCVSRIGSSLMIVATFGSLSLSAEPGADSTDNAKSPAHADESGLVRLHPQHEVWVDPKQKRVVVGGEICLRKGALEMFACPKGTKEHESIVSVKSKAYVVHTALLSIGATAGHPVRYDPSYQPATGTPIVVEVIWRGEDGKLQQTRAQQMIRRTRDGQAMQHDWVFGGSGFWKDESSGEKFYQAEGGELICLSNFSTAMLDLPVESSRDNADLLYEAFTDHIPPVGTQVRLVLSIK